MSNTTTSTSEEYWENFKLIAEDIESLYNHLLETETPLSTEELVEVLVKERLRQQREEIERQRTAGGDLYQPKLDFHIDQELIFPAFGWQHGKVLNIRSGKNPEIGEFKVIQVAFADNSRREFAANMPNHKLNEPPKVVDEADHLDAKSVINLYADDLEATLEEELITNPDFVRIAGKWFPRALLVNINLGHLNIAEAMLDMAGGGPLPTKTLLDQIGLPPESNQKLQEFSMDLALQEDGRFDEVGASGDVLWYLKRLEPPQVIEIPLFLQYNEIEHDRSHLTQEMLELERQLDDELSPLKKKQSPLDDVEVRLLFPHWRSGTLPLSACTRHLFPTAYESPRVRFTLVDGETKEEFQGWVVFEKRYVYGLEAWFESHNVIPGSVVHIRKGEKPGEVIVFVDNRRSVRDWIRTLLVGSDGGIVYAMLKQTIATPIDDRLAIAIPDKKALDPFWQIPLREQQPFEKLVVNTIRDLSRLNPQSYTHFSELYAAINVVRRVPPAPIMALLASRPWFSHVGDMHYRLSDTEDD